MNSIIVDNITYNMYDQYYYVSQNGDVYSMYTKKKLKHMIDVNGYHRVDIHGKHMKVHRLVYICWNGDIPDNMQINHIDDNKDNNSASNLYAGTQKQNAEDCTNNGHRVHTKNLLVVYDKQKDECHSFCPAGDFFLYCGHHVKDGGVATAMTRRWFKNRYDVVFYGKGVTTIPDECKEVG